jgi:hypothetical protein
LPGDVPTLVLTADPGIPVELGLPDGTVHDVVPALEPLRLTAGGGALDVLVLAADHVALVWVCEDGGRRRLLLSPDELSWGTDGRVEARGESPGEPAVTYRIGDLDRRGLEWLVAST